MPGICSRSFSPPASLPATSMPIRRRSSGGRSAPVSRRRGQGCLQCRLFHNRHRLGCALHHPGPADKIEILFVQMIGRGLRTADGKADCLILDHSDNHIRLGFVTDIHHDKLDDGRERRIVEPKDKEVLPKKCPKCTFLKPPKTRTCPACGFDPQPRCNVVAADGELVEMASRFAVRAPSMTEQATFYRELKFYAGERGYKAGWTAHKFREKFGRWPNRLDHLPPLEPSLATLGWRFAANKSPTPRPSKVPHGDDPCAAPRSVPRPMARHPAGTRHGSPLSQPQEWSVSALSRRQRSLALSRHERRRFLDMHPLRQRRRHRPSDEVHRLAASRKPQSRSRRRSARFSRKRDRPERSDDQIAAALNSMWRDAAPVRYFDATDRWLRSRRIAFENFPPDLRTTPRLRYYGATGISYHPAMLAKVTAATDKPATIHRTYLTAAGGEAAARARASCSAECLRAPRCACRRHRRR